ncbi:MAG: hypothetical protein KGZ59_01755 [Chitinophagaceae bacterium]|nr:hypothetical protein [Chitinophagaceae bacterium]
MQKLTNYIISGLLGFLIGFLFGYIFDSIYTKKSHLENKQVIQSKVFGIVGAFIGLYISFKLSEEEKKNGNKTCKECKINFSNDEYCFECIQKFRLDYINQIENFNSKLKFIKSKEDLHKVDELELIMKGLLK